MNKNQQILLGVAAVGVVGYYYWKSKQPKAAMVGYAGYANFKDTPCLCDKGSDTINGKTIYMCGDGKHLSSDTNGPCKGKKAEA